MKRITLDKVLEYTTPQTSIYLVQLEQCIAASGNAPGIEEDANPDFN